MRRVLTHTKESVPVVEGEDHDQTSQDELGKVIPIEDKASTDSS